MTYILKAGIGCQIDPTINIMHGADITLGDHVYIGPGVKILPGILTIGDYSKIHDNTIINPKNYVHLGHLTWIGQGCVIDGTGGLECGNFVGAGINSCLYSHIRHGDILEGCKYDNNGLLIIEDDVWFVGMCLVSPIYAKKKSMAFLGSVVTKDMEENHIYGGNPAKDLTDKIGNPWKEISMDEKMKNIYNYLYEYKKENINFDIDSVSFVEQYPSMLNDRTYYNLTDRTYTKHNTQSEIQFNKWLFKYKAKFIPK